MAKWRNFTFRSTAAGSATWTGGRIVDTTTVTAWSALTTYASGNQVQWNGIVYSSIGSGNLNHQPTGATDANWTLVGYTDANDANNVTTVVLAPMGVYPVLSADGVHSYGFSSSSNATGGDVSPTNAGNNALLGGDHSFAGTRMAAQFDVDAGTAHDVRIAMGAGSAARESIFIFDGTFTRLGSDLSGQVLNINIWASGTTAVLNTLVASKTDLNIWKLTTTNSSTYAASGEPNISGTGGTYSAGTGIYTDANGVQWTKQPRQMLAIIDVASAGGAVVADQSNGTGTASSSWAGVATLTLTSALGCFTLLRANTVTPHPRQFSVRAQAATLVDATLTDEAGQALTALYAGQPNGYKAFKIGGTAGASALANFSLGGTLATYFTLQTFNTTEVWGVANSTRLPESLVGLQSLTTVQTDAASTGSPHTTTFSLNVLSGQSRPLDNSLLGSITTQSWIARKATKAVTDLAWTGAVGKSYTTDTTVSDTASFLAAVTAAKAAATGTSYHRIQLGAGTYAGNQTAPLRLDFGSGGLLITPASGADPEFNIAYGDIQAHGLHFDGVLMPNDPTVTGGSTDQFILTDEGASGISGGHNFNRVLFTNFRIGFMYHPGNVITDWATRSCQFLSMAHGESLEFRSGSLWGNKLIAHPNTIRLQRYLDISVRQDSDDFVQIYNIANATVTLAAAVTAAIPGQTIFPDNNTYVDCSRVQVYADIDYVGYVNGKHCDTVQIGRSYANAPTWGNSLAYTAGASNYVVNTLNTPFRLYVCTQTGTSSATGTGPSGTTTGIVDGTAKWDYVLDLPTDADIYVLMEDVAVCSEGPLANQNDRQYFFDGNGGRGFKTFATILNGTDATSGIYGPAIGSGALNVEFCAFGGPPRVASGETVLGERILSGAKTAAGLGTVGDATLRAFHNIVVADTAGAGTFGHVAVATGGTRTTATTAVQDELSVDWSSTTGPAAGLTGPFSADSGGSGQATYPTLTDTPAVTSSAFRSALRTVFTPTSGTAGIFPDAAVVTGSGLSSSLSLALRLGL